MQICQETPKDYKEVYALVKNAFATAERSCGIEQELVEKLRKGKSFVPELSLVAEFDNCLVGHILFTEGLVGTEKVLILAPLAVLPEYQRQGIGQALIKKGHKIAKKLGYSYVVVTGSEKYYPKAGYKPAAKFGIEISANIAIAPVNVMAVCLREGANILSGIFKFPKEFGI